MSQLRVHEAYGIRSGMTCFAIQKPFIRDSPANDSVCSPWSGTDRENMMWSTRPASIYRLTPGVLYAGTRESSPCSQTTNDTCLLRYREAIARARLLHILRAAAPPEKRSA